MLILKENAANSVPTPPAGKDTFFIDDSGTPSVKNAAGNVTTFPTTAASNAQVLFMNGSAITGDADITWNYNTNVLTVAGNVGATRVLTDNLLYANGVAWDLQQAAGSNTQIQYNNNNDFGASANFTFNSSTNVLTVTGNISTGNVSATGLVSGATVAGTLTTAAQPNITSVGTLTGLGVNGNITAANITANTGVFTGNAAGLTNIPSGNISGQVANALVAGTVYTAAQPNITSVGTLTSLSVTGNANAGNIGATQGVFTNVSGNGSALSSLTGGNVTGAVAFATTANAVAGANVSGEVGFAAVANSVAGANVSGQVGNALVAGTVYTNAQPNITSVGTLTSVAVTGNATAGNVYANSGTVGASLLTGTLTTAAQPNITSVGTLTGLGVNGNITAANITANTGVFTGNAAGLTNIPSGNISGQVANALVSGTVYTNAQPNITSVGTLSSLAVTGNATAGNVYANSGTIGASLLTGTLTTAAQPNVTSVGTLSSLSVTGNVAAGNLTTTGVLSVTGTGVSSIAGNLDMTSNTIINLANPTNDQDAATKIYVDNIAQGLHVHAPCGAATPDTLANVTSGTITYNNGTSGVNANLVTTGSFNLIDGVNVQTSGTRILVKNEANAAHNGIYTWANSTTIVRATDFDTPTEMAGGDFTFVSAGTIYNDTGWVMTDPVTTVGTSAVNFVQFSGAGTYTAGTGLTLTGTVFSVNASQTQVTALGTVTSGTWNSLVGSSATFAAGLSGANLASITGGNVSGQVANALVAGTVYTAAQPNITSVGTLTSLAVTGNASAGNLNTAGKVVASTLESNVATGTAPLAVASTTRVANLNVAYANVADFVNVTTQSSGNAYLMFANGLTGNVSETANATFVANTSNGALYATTFVGAVSGNGAALTDLNASNISTGTLAQARLANSTITFGNTTLTLGATTTTVAGLTNITSTQLTSNVATGTAPLVVTSTTRVANLNVATAGAADTAGTVTTAAQPNITSVGTLTSLGVNGTVTAVAFTANTGIFTGNGSGLSALNASNLSSGTVPSARLTGSYSISVDSATTAGTVTTAAQPNITSVGTLTSLGSSGNITAPNFIANTGFFISSVSTGVSAAGTVQANATALTRQVSVVSTVSAGQGVVLPTAVAGMRLTVMNTSATAMNVYPASGAAINSLATNAAFAQAAGARLDFVATSTTQWYTLNATYA